MSKKIIFACIIIVGIFLRLWQLNTLPGGLFLDEINMAVDAKTLAQNGVDQYGRHFPFYFEDATDFKLPVYLYVTAFFYKVFGNQIITVHITSALAGIVSIFLLGYLTKQLFPDKKYLPYFAMATLALSPFAIHFSRIGFETNFGLSFLLLYFISLLHVIKNNRPKRWMILGSIAVLVADWTYPSPRFIIPVFTLLFLFCCYFLEFAQVKRKQLFQSLIFVIMVGVTFIPTIIFPFADQRQLNLLTIDTQGETLVQSVLLKISSVFVSFIRLWNLEFLFDKGDLFAFRHGTKENGIFLSLFVVPYILGILWSIKSLGRKHISLIFLFLLALVAGLPSALSSGVPYGTRVVPMLIPYCIFIALGVDLFFSWAKKKSRILQWSLWTAIGIVLLYQLGLFSYIYFVDFRETSLPEFPTAPVKLAQYITTFHAQNPQTSIYFLSDRSCHAWGNDALYLWYFDNLPNADMIAWNTAYRKVRYAYTKSSPFGAYDKVTIPSASIPSKKNYLYSGYKAQDVAPNGSLLVRCGYTLSSFNKLTEQLTKVFYMDDRTQEDAFYVVTTKK